MCPLAESEPTSFTVASYFATPCSLYSVLFQSKIVRDESATIVTVKKALDRKNSVRRFSDATS